MERVNCDLQYSGALLAFLLGAVAGAVGLALILPLPPFLQAAVGLYALAQGARAARESLQPRALCVAVGGRIEVMLGKHWRSGRVQPGTFVMPWLTIIRWRPDGARFDASLVLLPGTAARDAMRKIRVVLRWGSVYRSAASQPLREE